MTIQPWKQLLSLLSVRITPFNDFEIWQIWQKCSIIFHGLFFFWENWCLLNKIVDRISLDLCKHLEKPRPIWKSKREFIFGFDIFCCFSLIYNKRRSSWGGNIRFSRPQLKFLARVVIKRFVYFPSGCCTNGLCRSQTRGVISLEDAAPHVKYNCFGTNYNLSSFFWDSITKAMQITTTRTITAKTMSTNFSYEAQPIDLLID